MRLTPVIRAAAAIAVAAALAVPASALGAAEVRFVQATPGAGGADLIARAGGREVALTTDPGFGQASDYAPVPAGEVQFELGDDAEASARLEDDARYTVLAAREGSLEVLEDGKAAGGTARMRVVNAAPELGSVDVRLDERPIASDLDFRAASPYVGVEPGSYDLAATRPDGSGDVLVEDSDIVLTAGEATTALIVGSAGEPLSFLVLSDATAAPGGPPETGLGGLAGGAGPAWLAAALAALVAGGAGGLAFALTGRRRRAD